MVLSRPFASIVALTLAAILVSPAVAAGPQEPPSGLPPLVRNVDVTVTNIDVVVTDKKGNRIRGLKRDDFEVYEDGQLQPLTNFFAVDGGKVVYFGDEAVPGTASPAPAPAPAPAPEATPAPAEPAAAPLPVPKTKIVIFIDNLSLQPFNRNRVLKNLETWVRENVRDNVEAMVVTWDRSLKVRRKFTNDGREVSDVIRQQGDYSTMGQTRLSERRDILRRIDDAQSEYEAFVEARQYALAYKNDLDFTTDALKRTIDQLAGVEGRKILLHVSEGLPQSPGAELWKYIQDRFRTQSGGLTQFEFDSTSAYLGIIRAANAAGVSMYMVDASGLSIDEGISAENRSTQAKIDTFIEKTNLQSMIHLMAEETGGKAILNRNDITTPLAELKGDYTSYYSVGYRSLRSGGERPRKVEVKMKQKGLVARSRRSYVEKGLETRIVEGVTSALYFTRDENPLGVGIEVGQPAPADAQNYLVPIRIRVPYSRITVLPQGDVARGRIALYFIVIDAAGKQSELATQVVPVEIASKELDALNRRDFVYDVRLLMIPGGQRLSLAVRDEPTNTVSYVQQAIFVSALPQETPR
ncbi:MAG TPA: VWA domain-containing protein [Thermoanaerobaculia bacterium]|nr:VWA domain-containing protein [Thermoanaerobaculia bacterium]HQP86922.1 VWA domain-containing protein [Thermoanaerobaculia bacterium]